MYKSIVFLFLFISSISLSQVSYEPGYIIFDSGTKVDCYIQNLEWAYAPKDFKYKLNLDSDIIKVGSLSNVKVFGILDKLRYVKSKVEYDNSSNVASSLSNKFEPENTVKILFLKHLVEGGANLYEYQDNFDQKFYFSAGEEQIRELISKKFISKGKIKTNDSFKKQLFETLKCGSSTLDELKSLNYNKNDLIDYFKKYNSCSNSYVKVYESPNKGKFGITFKIGYFNPNVEIKLNEPQFSEDRQSATLASKSSIRIAAELEYTLPFNNNKWSLFVEPGYQSYSNSETFETGNVTGVPQTVSVDYEYIDIPIGLRYHMFFNENSKLILNAALAVTIDFSDIIDYEDDNEARDLKIDSRSNLLFGLGYVYNNKYSLEVRISANRNITGRESSIVRADYISSFGLIAGYKFL